MSQEQQNRLVGDDGELLQDFRIATEFSFPITREIEEASLRLDLSKAKLQRANLKLMAMWESKKPASNLACEYFTLGRGESRIVFCTNPLIIDDGDKLGIVYLTLCKKGFLTLGFPFRKAEFKGSYTYTINYISNPFDDETGSKFNYSFYQGNNRIWGLVCFHSMFRRQNPGREMKLKYQMHEGDVKIYNSVSKIERTTYGEKTILNESAIFVGNETAIDIFQNIQTGVFAMCEKKLFEINQQTSKIGSETGFVESLFGSKEKPKKGWLSALKRKK